MPISVPGIGMEGGLGLFLPNMVEEEQQQQQMRMKIFRTKLSWQLNHGCFLAIVVVVTAVNQKRERNSFNDCELVGAMKQFLGVIILK